MGVRIMEVLLNYYNVIIPPSPTKTYFTAIMASACTTTWWHLAILLYFLIHKLSEGITLDYESAGFGTEDLAMYSSQLLLNPAQHAKT